ncbi:multiple epidermal growth factor-like domains protein 10, partial [Saccostrea cucullata]|uniref:multiple epidermal growth factor-like domains protein 10 n=1 Tax=Saccostrea cuccullata TaxID=36930 RepID=UPI002ED2A9EA
MRLERQRGRFAGFSLYLSNSTNKEEGYRCFIDGQELPPLDFNTTCIGHARYVIYYNERLPDSEYPDGYPEGFEQSSITELCDVDVQGCSESGMYGQNCNHRCPEQCQEKRCHILDGTCLGCKPGWVGDLCSNECPVGKYGLECKQTCAGHCKDNANCDGVLGHCSGGCASGWTGTLCDKECLDGSYGENCVFSCSGHCLHGKPCNKISGNCDEGCSPGYLNGKCDQICESGHFGNKCTEVCSTYCFNDKKCNHTTGHCDIGCKDGYVGERCDKECSKGHYGPKCSQNCSGTCSNNSCSNVNGKCSYGCEPGYQGFNCSNECSLQTYGEYCGKGCSKRCVHNETCNHVTGVCDNGCANGFIGPLCKEECTDGYFGNNCSSTCPENCTKSCDHVSGMCPCSSGWHSETDCKKGDEIRGRGKFSNREEDTLTVELSVGTSILFLICLLSAILFLRLRKKLRKDNQIENQELIIHPTEERRKSFPMHRTTTFEQDITGSVPTTPLLKDPGYANDLRGGLSRSNKTISTKDLECILDKMSQDDDAAFKNEYK